MDRTLLPCLLLVAFGLIGCEPEPEPEPEPTPAPAAGPLADDLQLSLVTINQSVAVPLVIEQDAVLLRNAPVVAGRPGILRVFVTPDGGFDERELVAELVLQDGGDADPSITRVTMEVQGPSFSSDLASTFNFPLAAEQITEQTRFSVAVRELSGAPRIANDGPAWPAPSAAEPDEALDGAYSLGLGDLGASAWGGVVRVYIIPVRYDTDGSGRLPDTSEEQLAVLRDTMLRFYPVRDIEITVGEPHATTLPFDSSSEPMSDLLEEVISIRREREIPFDTYAYAMVNPAPTREEYCGGGCTSGIAYRVTNPNADHLRSGVGLGYGDENTAETMAHEVGHNHDRGHAPCGGAGNTDPDYPYPVGGTGVWGWDALTGELKAPSEHSDVMGYCTPRWISDYQYDRLWRRAAAVEGLASWEGDEQDWQIVALRPGGRSRIKGTVGLRAPDGEAVMVTLRGWGGAELGKVLGYAAAIEDAAPGVATLLLPALEPTVRAIEVGGVTIPR